MDLLERPIGGLPMRWAEHGAGPPVVFVHGLPTSPRLWRYVLPRIPRARGLAWEMVGYGSSIPAGRGRHISVSRQADHLLDWLDTLEIGRAVWVGHDLGGGVVQIAAARHPDRCAGLVLTNSIAYDAWPVPEVQALRVIAPALERTPRLVFGAFFRAALRRGHDDRRRGAESARLHWKAYAGRDGATALLRQVRSLHVQDTLAISEELPRLRIPARIVWGAADPFLPVEYAERLSRDLRAPLTQLPTASHFTPEDHPDAIAEAVNELLRETTVSDVARAPQRERKPSPEPAPQRERKPSPEPAPQRERASRAARSAADQGTGHERPGTERVARRRAPDWERREQERLPPRGTAMGQTDPVLPPRPDEHPPPRDPSPRRQSARRTLGGDGAE